MVRAWGGGGYEAVGGDTNFTALENEVEGLWQLARLARHATHPKKNIRALLDASCHTVMPHATRLCTPRDRAEVDAAGSEAAYSLEVFSSGTQSS